MNRLTPLCLPEEIVVVIDRVDRSTSDSRDRQESVSGTRLVTHLLRDHFGAASPAIVTRKYEKPSADAGNRIFSVSFSHTKTNVTAAASASLVVGVDMEMCNREVHPRLMSRMRHREEPEKVYTAYDPIQVWTMKEAALKAIGTGLRKPMNSVRLYPISENNLEIEFNNGKKAKICSFCHNDQWISICYMTPSTANEFLSPSYVPNHS